MAQPSGVRLRPSASRGHTNWGWLDSRHSFSLGNYFDPDHMGFRSLRVINDDRVEPGQGFGQHPHRDAEIFSYVIAGALEHRDSMGNGSVIRAGHLQYMSAGSGVTHSEFNASKTEPVHFLQVWLTPRASGGAPRYAERAVADTAPPDALTLVLSGAPHPDAIEIRQDADVYFGRLSKARTLTFSPPAGRSVWIHVIAGALSSGGASLGAGDGLGLFAPDDVGIEASADAEFLLFALAG